MKHQEILDALRETVSSGSIKTKGAYECLPYDELGWHKNHSSMVIQLAVAAHLLELCDYKTFIMNHKDPFDFCLRTKVPRSSRLVMVFKDSFGVDEEVVVQNICRYVPVKDGGKLVKIMPPLPGGTDERRLSIDSKYDVRECNDMDDFDWNIDYDYYFDKAEKLVNAIIGDDSDEGEED
jgi:hypothetical protein